MEYIRIKSKVKQGFYLLYPKSINPNWFNEQKMALRSQMSKLPNLKSASFLASNFFNIKYIKHHEHDFHDKVFLNEMKGDAVFLDGFKIHLQQHDFYFTIDWSRTTNVMTDAQEIIKEKDYLHKNENKRFKLELELDLCTALDEDQLFDEFYYFFSTDLFVEMIQKEISKTHHPSHSQVLRTSLEVCKLTETLKNE